MAKKAEPEDVADRPKEASPPAGWNPSSWRDSNVPPFVSVPRDSSDDAASSTERGGGDIQKVGLDQLETELQGGAEEEVEAPTALAEKEPEEPEPKMATKEKKAAAPKGSAKKPATMSAKDEMRLFELEKLSANKRSPEETAELASLTIKRDKLQKAQEKAAYTNVLKRLKPVVQDCLDKIGWSDSLAAEWRAELLQATEQGKPNPDFTVEQVSRCLHEVGAVRDRVGYILSILEHNDSLLRSALSTLTGLYLRCGQGDTEKKAYGAVCEDWLEIVTLEANNGALSKLAARQWDSVNRRYDLLSRQLTYLLSVIERGVPPGENIAQANPALEELMNIEREEEVEPERIDVDLREEPVVFDESEGIIDVSEIEAVGRGSTEASPGTPKVGKSAPGGRLSQIVGHN